ncbi:hypothetical protein F5Y19DRAFT_371826 [Xylariaceae sp. FL1651]|nr:hypothetical protein F5Y19DRAFT_371826 [Xylariaceae sp. FL1651]
MYFAEHQFLGDTVDISKDGKAGPSGASTTATALTLENGLVVTYGEINGFAGDYFGLVEPISSGDNIDKRKEMFQRWFDLLGHSPCGKSKAEAIREELKPINHQVNDILRSVSSNPDELAAVYKNNPLNVWSLDAISKDPRWISGASFLQLAEANIDHFGLEARLTYDAGHALALDWAAKGDISKALAINGFADHFLEDSFAAGHMRVPRAGIAEVARKDTTGILHKAINLSSYVMHEEDGELGLWVESPCGDKWKAYGDGRLNGIDTTDKATSTNISQCRKALQQSVKEVYDAYTSKQVIGPSQFAAWQHAPIMDKISLDKENHSPLVKIEGGKLFSRVYGPKTVMYEETSDYVSWISFYEKNHIRVEDQLNLLGKKILDYFTK